MLLGADDIPGELAEYTDTSPLISGWHDWMHLSMGSNRIGIGSRNGRQRDQTLRRRGQFLPPDFESQPEWDVCIASIMRPARENG